METLKNLNDRELANLVINNNAFANTELYNRYYKFITGKLYHNGIKQSDSEDLLMIIFSKIFEKINKFDTNKGSLTSWIGSITKNTIIDYFRKTKNRHQTIYLSLLQNNDEEYTFDIASSLLTDHQIITKENLTLVFNAINLLPNKYKTIIELLIEEKNNIEIAQITGITANAVGVQKTRALKQLQNLLLTFKL